MNVRIRAFSQRFPLFAAMCLTTSVAFSSLAFAQTPLTADFTGDGIVDQADLVRLLRHAPSTRGDGRYSIAQDLNMDGSIDRRDVFEFVTRWHGAPPPRTQVASEELLTRLGLADIEGQSFEIQCAPGGTPDVICSGGMTVSSEALEDFNGTEVRPVDLRLNSGGGAWRGLISSQGDLRLMQLEVTEAISSFVTLPTQTISLPTQTITPSHPVLLTPTNVQSGVPFTDQGTADVEVSVAFLSGKPLFTLQTTASYTGEAQWIDCSGNGDWSYVCFIGEMVIEGAVSSLIVRTTMLFGPNGLLSFELSYELAGTENSFLGVTVPPPPGVGLDLYLTSPSPSPVKQFGSRLALSEDLLFVLDRYIYATTPINSPIYAYDLVSPASTPQHTYLPPEPQDVDLGFGSGIAPAGKNVLIGSSSSSADAEAAGAAYLFNADPSSQEFGGLVLRLQNPSPSEWGLFGAAVAIAGGRLAVTSAPHPNPPPPTTPVPGSAYLYDGSPESPTFGDHLATFAASEPSTTDRYGAAAALTEKGVLFVGAPFTPFDATGAAGAIHAYDADPSSSTYKEFLGTIWPPEPIQGGQFGQDMEVVGDVLAVPSAGTVELFDADPGSPGFLGHLKTLRPPSEGPTSFGYPIASAGMRLVVGEIGYPTGGTGTGAVHLYDLDPNGPDFGGYILTVPNPAPESVTQFGLVVAGYGNRFAASSRFVAGVGADTVFLFSIIEP